MRSSEAIEEAPSEGWVGKSLLRREDAALLMGAGRFADDAPVAVGTLHAAIVRSPEAHALIKNINASKALAAPGVRRVITGEEVRALTTPFLVVLKQPIDQWGLAVERVRYVGEAVALVLAGDRYLAEDAAELVEVEYERLQPVIDPEQAVGDDAVLLHPPVGSNELSSRDFTYGDPDAQFQAAEHTVKLHVEYPRSSYTPMECFVVVAEYLPGDDSYDTYANFQGPFSIHPVMARALGVPSAKLRLRTPADSGGSFGIKLSVFPYVVLMAVAAKIAGRPVKWTEDRLEHLVAASSGPNRVMEIEAAVGSDGKVAALRMDNLEDYGAFLRAPMPGPLYRMHGATTGAYDIRHLFLRNRVAVTNKAPAALIRGFGGPQLYLALERLMHQIAVELKLDPLDVIRRNLIPADKFPYRSAAGALYDSGDYQKAVEITVGEGRLEDLKRRQEAARNQGKHYGIGFAAVVEPGMSNMGYLSTILAPETRERQGPKNGAISMATVSVDAVGAISVTADITVQGQGHATALSQIVADRLGVDPDRITVNLEMDTQKDPWSIAAGTYSCRFTPGTAVAAHMAADRIRHKVARIAAKQLNTLPDDIDFGEGRVFSKRNPDNAAPFERIAGTAHWSPVMLPEEDEAALRETAVWAPPELTPPTSKDEINTSLTYGFVFDMCGVEIDPVTMEARVDRYVTMHDAGRLINPLLVEGQIRGAFVQGLSSALYEEFIYDDQGTFLSGTFADYLVPTAPEIPEVEILHIETPSPLTPLGAKGTAEGNCMSTPVCIANAIADALSLRDIPIPATPKRLNDLVAGEEPASPVGQAPEAGKTSDDAPALQGEGDVVVPGTPLEIWAALLDPDRLGAIIPGCKSVAAEGVGRFVADVALGVGPIKGSFRAKVELSELDEARFTKIGGQLSGPLGSAEGGGEISLSPEGEGTHIRYTYRVNVGGKVASVGGRMLQRAAQLIIGQFFERLSRSLTDPEGTGKRRGALSVLKRTFGAKQ